LFCIHNTCDPNSIFGSDFDDLAICVERKRWTGWPDWANFRLMGGCLLWVVFFKIAEVAHTYVLHFSKCISYIFIFAKKRDGLHFGRLFHKLIWSPWRWKGFREKVKSFVSALHACGILAAANITAVTCCQRWKRKTWNDFSSNVKIPEDFFFSCFEQKLRTNGVAATRTGTIFKIFSSKKMAIKTGAFFCSNYC
jgi:hypothetical protein